MEWPRAIYRGNTHRGVIDDGSETKRCESPDQFDLDVAAGWRLDPRAPEDMPKDAAKPKDATAKAGDPAKPKDAAKP